MKLTVQPSQQICVDNSEVAVQVLPKWDMVAFTLHLLTDLFTGLLLGMRKQDSQSVVSSPRRKGKMVATPLTNAAPALAALSWAGQFPAV